MAHHPNHPGKLAYFTGHVPVHQRLMCPICDLPCIKSDDDLFRHIQLAHSMTCAEAVAVAMPVIAKRDSEVGRPSNWVYVDIPAPDGISFAVPRPVEVKIAGIDKQLVGEMAARIRKIRPPEPYKGKGVRYAGEVVRRKEGKKK